MTWKIPSDRYFFHHLCPAQSGSFLVHDNRFLSFEICYDLNLAQSGQFSIITQDEKKGHFILTPSMTAHCRFP